MTEERLREIEAVAADFARSGHRNLNEGFSDLIAEVRRLQRLLANAGVETRWAHPNEDTTPRQPAERESP